MHTIKPRFRNLSPLAVISGSFLFLIILGTLLLKLPIATEKPISWIDAFFSATSGTTVTGLSVFDVESTLTLFGEIVMLVLIQCGGIGLMTFAVVILVLLGRKIGLKNRIYIQESFSQSSIGGMVKLVQRICIFVFSIEGVAIVIMSMHWIPDFGWAKGIYYSIFHVVSAFNNAGFALFPDNLIQFAGDPIVNIILSLLFIIGGLGFVVVMEILQKNSFNKWSLHTKMMIVGTVLLNSIATIIIFVLEYNNPSTIGNFSLFDKFLASYFQAVAPRTAGFNTIATGEMEDTSLLFTMLLMFIGGGSASTASGIKLTTFMVVLLSTISFIRGIQEPHLFNRSIKTEIIIRSLAIVTVSMFINFFFISMLTITENIPLLPLAFEVVSSFGTVGLSTGITADLSNVGKVVLCIVMFIGRIGPLTLFFLLLKPKKEKYKFPNDQVHTG
ncbi:TrkH family potassium uptake protein [Psychrobacillus soli]|uniref:Ktr system potassium transporter B n=1 Tax=Psychrobacillus soli TaxID=1543965 RepID=A0A544TDY2_9BACI|nr:TrkH family potassium uptake protein [Psychrobacillus soli]TQR15606.1 Ktr system potassium transporter B [Psychrobacillus soli]